MALNVTGILDAVVSHALSLGFFEAVNTHEPKSSPGHGLSAAVWVQDIGPGPGSGLASTSSLLVLNLRLYTSMLTEPQDAIDPNLMDALDALMAAYHGDFTLDGLVRNVDVFGAGGVPLRAQAGYITQDSTLLRVMTIALPLIVNDLWEQVA